jgi:hypothetical protein
MEALEQEVFKYKKMSEREVDIIHRINQELIAKHKKETAELCDDILSLHQTTNKLQAQLYDLQNQNCEYEARFKQMSVAASFRILETKTSFLDGEPLPWKSDDDKDSPPPPKEKFVISIGIPLVCSKLGGVPWYHIIIFYPFTFQVESYHE